MTTYYETRRDTRCVLTHQIIEEAMSLNSDIVIVDGSRDPAIADSFRERGAIVFPQQERGMAASRREVFSHAGNYLTYPNRALPFCYVWMEEKPDLVRSIPLLFAPLIAGEADIVIAKRLSMETWPTFQQESEARANAAYRDAIGWDYDPMFGPVAFTQRVVLLFASCYPTLWGVSAYAAGYIQHFAPLYAYYEGYGVTSVAVDCSYPEIQRQEEETTLVGEMLEKRRQQMEELSQGYHIACRHLRIGKYRNA